MRMSQLLVLSVLSLVAILDVRSAKAESAQEYPSKTIRIVIGFTPGGAPDLTARFIAQRLSERWGQPVIVENRPGAGSAVAARYVATASSDGYTLLSVTSAHAVLPAINPQLGYDTRKDLAGITLTSIAPMWVLASPSLGVRSLTDLVALAKAKPGQLNYASAGVGSLMHFGAELFDDAAGIKAQHIPYKGPPEALTETVSGRVQFTVSPVGAAASLVRDGRLVALAVTGKERIADFPNVPTTAEAGLPTFELMTWTGLLAPAGTPADIITKLNKEIVSILDEPAVKEKWAVFGVVSASTSPRGFDQVIGDNIDAFTKAAIAANVQVK